MRARQEKESDGPFTKAANFVSVGAINITGSRDDFFSHCGLVEKVDSAEK